VCFADIDWLDRMQILPQVIWMKKPWASCLPSLRHSSSTSLHHSIGFQCMVTSTQHHDTRCITIATCRKLSCSMCTVLSAYCSRTRKQLWLQSSRICECLWLVASSSFDLFVQLLLHLKNLVYMVCARVPQTTQTSAMLPCTASALAPDARCH
jgi:hypothetical protein